MHPAARLDALTGLRFVAAVWVAVAHLPHLHADPSVTSVGRRFMTEGGLGVPFFFVLSGFVLAYAYHARLATPTRPALKEYYFARVGRVWPVHLLTLGLAAVVVVNPAHENGPVSAVLNALLLHAWPPNLAHVSSFNSVSWTLSIESFFYLCLPLWLWAVARWRAGPRALTAAAVVAWVVPAVLTACLTPYATWWALYFGAVCPVVRSGEFLVGLFLGLAFVRGAPARGSRLAWTLAELAAVLLLALLVHRSHHVPLLLRSHGYYTPAVALIVAVFARQRGWLSWLMGARVPAYLGEISFSFFMVHGVVFVQLGKWIPPGDLGPWPRAAVYLAAATLASSVVHHAFELPLRTWIARMGKPRKPTVVPEVEPARVAA